MKLVNKSGNRARRRLFSIEVTPMYNLLMSRTRMQVWCSFLLLFLAAQNSAYGQSRLYPTNSQDSQSAPELNRPSHVPQYLITLRSSTLVLKLTETISSSSSADRHYANSTNAIVVTPVVDGSGHILIPKDHEIELRYTVFPGKRMHLRVGEIHISIRPVLVEFEGEADPACPNCAGLDPGVWEFDVPASVRSATNSLTGRIIGADAEGGLKDRKSKLGAAQSENGAINSVYSALAAVPGGVIIYGISNAVVGGFKFIFGRSETTLPVGTSITLSLDHTLKAKYLAPSARSRPLPNTLPYRRLPQ